MALLILGEHTKYDYTVNLVILVMNLKHIVFAILSLIVFQIHGQETFQIKYLDKVEKTEILPVLPKAKRLSSRGSVIKGSHSEMPENIQKCVDFAMKIWESKIENAGILKIGFIYDSCDTDIETDVIYVNVEGVGYPYSLYASINKLNDEAAQAGVIKISNSVDWDCSVSGMIDNNKKSLTLGLLKGIGRILGIGSSLKINAQGKIAFKNGRYYSLFDELIRSTDGMKLTDIPRKGTQSSVLLDELINSGNRRFYVKENIDNYYMAEGPYSVYNPPLVYMKNGLMSYVDNRKTQLMIDDITLSIMQILGWNSLEDVPLIEIKSDDIKGNGLASAYLEHKFKITGIQENIVDGKWIIEKTMASGEISSQVFADNTGTFTLPPIDDESLYAVDVDGLISCRLKYSCKINGKIIEANPFTVYWEVKPLIEYVRIINIKDDLENASYDVEYEIKYRGADIVRISLEEEYVTAVKSDYVEEPLYFKGKIEKITSPFYAWIDFDVSNNYGTAIYTIEFEPYHAGYYPLSINQDSKAKICERMVCNIKDMNKTYIEGDFDMVMIYDGFGNLLYEGKNLNEYCDEEAKKLRIIRYMKEGKCINYKKVLL